MQWLKAFEDLVSAPEERRILAGGVSHRNWRRNHRVPEGRWKRWVGSAANEILSRGPLLQRLRLAALRDAFVSLNPPVAHATG